MAIETKKSQRETTLELENLEKRSEVIDASITNRNQGYLASLEPSSPTTASPGYPKILEKYDSDLKITSWSNPLSPA